MNIDGKILHLICASALAGVVSNAAAQTAGVPVIGTGAAGDTQAFVFFSAPASNRGIAIMSYTATCVPGAGMSMTGSSSTAPIPGVEVIALIFTRAIDRATHAR